MADSFAVQRGEEPAENIRDLVDALRQNLAGAGADLGSLFFLLEPLDDSISPRVFLVLHRLKGHLAKLDEKTTLALNAYYAKEKQVREAS